MSTYVWNKRDIIGYVESFLESCHTQCAAVCTIAVLYSRFPMSVKFLCCSINGGFAMSVFNFVVHGKLQTYGAARVGMQLRSSPKVSTSSPLVSPSSIMNVPRELYSIDVAATFRVSLTTVGDLQKLINDIDAGKHDELLSELTNEDRMETLEAVGSLFLNETLIYCQLCGI
ncbi:hypothetical protein Tco_0193314 [Tanacetum coccineum]